jgi:tetratricopeptide (TPR) repeat protein/transcriptional regulator with XRE-family HTH domain
VADRSGGIGELVRRHRVAAELTQEELAERAGLSVRAISDIERGCTARPHRNSISLLAAALGLAGPSLREFALAGGLHESTWPKDRPGPLAQPANSEAGSLPVPRQLPARAAHFVGRGAEIEALDGLLKRGTAAPGTVVISAIAGTAGIGKTALALHWAHLAADRFPDGQLYVNLRGFDPSGPPVTPAAAIRGFLDALGPAQDQIPASPDAQAGLYRGLLAARRMLIVLDNARDASQVRPLLPASPGCLVVVTSRNQLADLVAVDGAYPLALDLLAEAEAAELLSQRLGVDRLAAEPEAARELTGLCARLPLALCIAAARAATHPHFPLASLAADLRDTARRLDVLAVGEEASLRAVFSWSYQHLLAPAARMFRLLGLHPGPDTSAAAAASLAGIPADQARQALAELHDANLLTEPVPRRYACHDLLRRYAAELAEAGVSPEERQAAIHRMLDHYLHTARKAARVVYPNLEETAVAPPRAGVVPEHVADYEQAMAWFAAEHRVLLAAVAKAADAGLDIHAWQLSAALTTFLNRRGHWDSLLTVQQTGLAAALRLGDLKAQSITHRNLGMTQSLFGSYAEARAHLVQALEVCRQLGDRPGEGRAHNAIATLFYRQGRYSDSMDHCLQALSLFQAADDRSWQAIILNNIGYCQALLGNHQLALGYCQQSMTLHQELGDRNGQAFTSDSLGLIHRHLGHHAEAVDCHDHALALFRDLGDRLSQAKVLVNLGDVHQAASSAQAAREAWQQALEILDDLHHQDADQVRARLRAHPAPATVPAGPGTGRGRQASGRAVGGIAAGSTVSPVR